MKKQMPKKMPKEMQKEKMMHKMPSGMMMKDTEMKKMMNEKSKKSKKK